MKKTRQNCLSCFPVCRIGSFEVISLENIKNALLGVLLAAFAAALVLFPAEASEAARQGLRLCFSSVLPSLFPFFVLSSLVIALGAADAFGHALEPMMRPLFSLGGAGASALALGLVGGYPVGARTVAELYRGGSLSKDEAERLLGFCNNAGPGFILGICGGAVLRSTRTGLYLYLIHVAAAVLVGAAMGRFRPARRTIAQAKRVPAQPKGFAAAFPSAVRDSFAAVWSVCGFVVLSAVVLRFVTLLLPASVEHTRWYPLLLGSIELTNGVTALSAGRPDFVLCAVLLGWGGSSVHAQTLSVLEGTDLSARWYFLGKILQAALSAPLACLAANWLY